MGRDRQDHRAITWVVRPALSATPWVIAFKADPDDPPAIREVVVESTGNEFRVLAVEGKAVAAGYKPPGDRSRTHRLLVPMVPAAGISELTIQTDHPDQPIAKVSVLIQARTASEATPGGSP